MRKPTFCICENKDADQDQRLRFRYTDSTMPLLPKYKNIKRLASFSTLFSSGSFCQVNRVTDEALIAETAVWPNFFLMNVFFALRGFKLFIIICGCTARFVWDLVRNPEDRFSHNEAHILDGSDLEWWR